MEAEVDGWRKGWGDGGGHLVRVGASTASTSWGAAWRAVNRGAGVPDGLVHRQDEAGGLGSGGERVDAHDGRLPHARLEVVGDVLVVDVHAIPHATLADEGRIRMVSISNQNRGKGTKETR